MRFLIPILFLLSCLTVFSQAKTYDFLNPVDTQDKEISLQEKKTYKIGSSLFIDNKFDGARLNNLAIENDSTIQISINPENIPINPSPWFAFRLWTIDESRNVTITIIYPEKVRHRYWPKMSNDGYNWSRLKESNVEIAVDTSFVKFSILVNPDTTWISAQPLETSERVKTWCKEIAENKNASFDVIGKSRNGRDLFHLKLGKGKKTIVLLSRQHPPEVTGYYALKSFVSRLADNSKLSKSFFKKYTVHIYPLLNPDGVDMGHWRHNAGGVDLNRDWAYYRQPEIKQIADHIVNIVSKTKSKEVSLGLDFHSTYYDVYYTTASSIETVNKLFTDDWLNYLKENLVNYEINDQPSGLGAPVSKGWFITQFNAPGITFEIGDNTPTDFIDKKGKVAAEGMMRVLLGKN